MHSQASASTYILSGYYTISCMLDSGVPIQSSLGPVSTSQQPFLPHVPHVPPYDATTHLPPLSSPLTVPHSSRS